MENNDYTLFDVIQEVLSDPEICPTPEDAGLVQMGMMYGLAGLTM